MEHETISLKYIKSERAFEILNRFFIGANIEYKKHVFTNEQDNELYLYGDKILSQFVLNIIKEIDTESFIKAEEYDVLTYNDSKVGEIASSVKALLEDMNPDYIEKVTIKPVLETNQLLVYGNKEFCGIIKTMTKEEPHISNFLSRKTFTLKNMAPDLIKTKINEYFYFENSAEKSTTKTTTTRRTSYGTIHISKSSKNEIITTTYPSLNQIVILASEENLKLIEKLINQWDQEQVNNNNAKSEE